MMAVHAWGGIMGKKGREKSSQDKQG